MILARKIKKSKDFLQIFGMWKHFLDILWNSDKIWWSRENCKILTMLFEILWKNAKIRDENFLKYWGLSGAKACKSCRSRQELSNEYLLAKIGFDTAENEPFNFHNFSSLQGFNFHGAVVSPRGAPSSIYFPQASLHCRGLLVSSPGLCFSPGWRLPEALFMVSRLDSKAAKVCKSCRSRQELSNEYVLAQLGFDTAESGPLKVCKQLANG